MSSVCVFAGSYHIASAAASCRRQRHTLTCSIYIHTYECGRTRFEGVYICFSVCDIGAGASCRVCCRRRRRRRLHMLAYSPHTVWHTHRIITPNNACTRSICIYTHICTHNYSVTLSPNSSDSETHTRHTSSFIFTRKQRTRFDLSTELDRPTGQQVYLARKTNA